MTRDSDRNGNRQDRNGLGPKGEGAGLEEASPIPCRHRPEDVGLVEKVEVLAPVRVSDDEWWFFSPDGRKWIARPESILTPYTVDGSK